MNSDKATGCKTVMHELINYKRTQRTWTAAMSSVDSTMTAADDDNDNDDNDD